MNRPTHPTYAMIDLAAIRANVANICNRVAPAEVMAVVKADAYGHGAVPVARTALAAGATRLAVAHPAEGAELRAAGIDAPIQVFGGFSPEQIPELHRAHLEITLCSSAQLDHLGRYVRKTGATLPVHVKFDTGMRRMGFWWEEAARVLVALKAQQGFRLTGLMTHFATADAQEKGFAREQLRRFKIVIEKAQKVGIDFKYIHAANSGAILDLPETYFNLVRPGISIYGYYPSNETTESIPLQPALTWVSRLVRVMRIRQGETVSYGATWSAPRDTVLGTVAAGYADGYRRALSNRMHALLAGRRVPVVGRVCMDMILLDLGPNARAKEGERVVLLGRDAGSEIAMQEFCAALGTIPYEITCMISKRVPRIYGGLARRAPAIRHPRCRTSAGPEKFFCASGWDISYI